MSRFILVRHSNSLVQPGVAPHRWLLSDVGKERARKLALILGQFGLTALVSSNEPKAMETAEIVAQILGLENSPVEGLHEHERTPADWMGGGGFEERVSDFFTKPNQLVFGQETANVAQTRFSRAIHRLLLDHEDETVAAVSHGTVISLFVGAWNDVDPFQFWQSLEMPSVVVMTREYFKLESIHFLEIGHSAE